MVQQDRLMKQRSVAEVLVCDAAAPLDTDAGKWVVSLGIDRSEPLERLRNSILCNTAGIVAAASERSINQSIQSGQAAHVKQILLALRMSLGR